MEAGDRVFRHLFFSAGLTCALAGLMVLGFMVVLGFPLIRSGMLWEILTGPWSPDHGQFGILAMAVSSVYAYQSHYGKTELIYWDATKTYNGYTIFTPFSNNIPYLIFHEYIIFRIEHLRNGKKWIVKTCFIF